MGSDLGTFLFMLLLILFSAFFSASETAFSSMNRVRLKTRMEDGDRKARMALRLDEKYDALISSILIGNNIVNITLSSVATVYFVSIMPASGATVATIVTTIVVLIFGEITPKSIAKDYAESLSCAFAPILRLFVTVFFPLNWLFSKWKRLLMRTSNREQAPSVTDDELRTYVEEAQEEGGIGKQEGELLQNVLSFYEQDTEHILTPRVDVIGISEDAKTEEIEECFAQSRYSRLPVYRETLDNIVGVLHVKDFYGDMIGGEKTLAEAMKPAVFVAPTLQINVLLKTLQSAKSHLAVVTDEYGGTAGIVTLEDVLEELVGDIWDEHDDIEKDTERLPDGSIRVSGGMELESFFEQYDFEGEAESTTVGGWAMERLGRIPQNGETFVYGGYRFTVCMEDKTRVDELIAVPCSLLGENT